MWALCPLTSNHCTHACSWLAFDFHPGFHSPHRASEHLLCAKRCAKRWAPGPGRAFTAPGGPLGCREEPHFPGHSRPVASPNHPSLHSPSLTLPISPLLGWGHFFTVLIRHACMLSRFSRVRPCATLCTAAHRAPLSTGVSRQEYCNGLPFPSPVLIIVI